MQTRLTPAVCATAIAFSSLTRAFAEVLLDQMDMVRFETYDYGNGNAIGADDLYGGGEQVALQICNVFQTTRTGYVINQVEVANAAWIYSDPITDVRVSFYADQGGYPAEDPVYSQRFSSMDAFSPTSVPGIRSIQVNNQGWELIDLWTIVSGLHIVLEPDTTYYVCVQVCTGPDHWAWTIRDAEGEGADSFCRDGPAEEDACRCGYGFAHWRTMEEAGYGAGDAAYRIVATGAAPPPPPMPGPEQFIEPVKTDQPPRGRAYREARRCARRLRGR